MSDYAFSWPKAIQLIVIWEFSTAVSPTSVGGAGVAFWAADGSGEGEFVGDGGAVGECDGCGAEGVGGEVGGVGWVC